MALGDYLVVFGRTVRETRDGCEWPSGGAIGGKQGLSLVQRRTERRATDREITAFQLREQAYQRSRAAYQAERDAGKTEQAAVERGRAVFAAELRSVS